MEILFLILYITISSLVYSIASDQQLGFNPYPFGTTILCMMFHPLILISSIFYLGWVWGIIFFLLHIFGITHAAVGWVFNFPALLTSNEEQLLRILKLKLGLLGPCLCISIIFTVISFFAVDFKMLLDLFKDDSTFTIMFIVIIAILSILRIVISKLLSNIGNEQEAG